MSNDLAILVSIPSLARKIGRDRKSLWRLLMRLHELDREAGRAEWLFRVPGEGRRVHVRVNVEALYEAHPELRRAPEERALDGVVLERLAADFKSYRKSQRERERIQNRLIGRLSARMERLERERSASPLGASKVSERLIG